MIKPFPHRGTLDGSPFTHDDHYRSDGGPGEVDPSSPMMLQQPHLPPTGLYWVRHFRRRYQPLAGAQYFGDWCDEWKVARVFRPTRRHARDHFPGRLEMIGLNSRECELFDLSEAEWRTMVPPDPA